MIAHAHFQFKKVTLMWRKTPKNIIFYTHYLYFQLYIVHRTTTNSCYNKLKMCWNWAFYKTTDNHNLLIAKLGTYGFERDSLYLMKSYLNDRQQRVCVNNNFSSSEKIIAGLQVSILGPLLFNNSNLSNYADDNTYMLLVLT